MSSYCSISYGVHNSYGRLAHHTPCSTLCFLSLIATRVPFSCRRPPSPTLTAGTLRGSCYRGMAWHGMNAHRTKCLPSCPGLACPVPGFTLDSICPAAFLLHFCCSHDVGRPSVQTSHTLYIVLLFSSPPSSPLRARPPHSATQPGREPHKNNKYAFVLFRRPPRRYSALPAATQVRSTTTTRQGGVSDGAQPGVE